jgi:glycosyltransferase involved in cell wall biosynthesis
MTIKKPIQFAVVVPSFNNEYWLSKNVSSIAKQSYPNFRLHYIDDASTDETKELVEMFTLPIEEKAKIVHNKMRRGSLANFYATIHALDPEVVVVCVDGDDWLAHDHVLSRLATIYDDQNVWLTYGSFATEPPGKIAHRGYPQKVQKENAFRSYPFLGVHLKSFYAGLFQKIKKEDLTAEDGEFFKVAGDLAFMLPMLEMSSQDHQFFVKETLYIYNCSNPISDAMILREKQEAVGKYLREREAYKPLTARF